MMSAVAGSLETVSVAGREFQCAGEGSVNRKLGGYEKERKMNGNQKTSRKLMTPTPWGVTGSQLEIDDSLGDLEYLTAIQNQTEDVDLVFTWVSGSVYQGVGSIEGEMTDDNMEAVVSIDWSGDGELKKM